ncbi:hypothetical protein [Anaerotruncus rubiinfantis]|uniref:hypothetical protein n=1 Tax=Anaerotruncus rubiinfantis TaxID=1720200 RepID=UPI0034A133CB
MNEKRIRDVIDSRLSEIKLSPRLQNAILRGARPPARLRPAAVLLAACLAVLLSVGTLAAVVPGFRDLLDVVGQDVARLLTPVERACESNGIRLELVAAINDGQDACVYITLQDLTGRGRTKDIARLFPKKDAKGSIWSLDSPLSTAFRGDNELIFYDETTQTATFCVQSKRNISREKRARINGKTTFSLGGFLRGETRRDSVDTGLSASDIPQSPVRNETGSEPALAFDACPKSLSSIDWLRITNIGFIENDLRILTEPTRQLGYYNRVSFDLRDEKGTPLNDGSTTTGSYPALTRAYYPQEDESSLFPNGARDYEEHSLGLAEAPPPDARLFANCTEYEELVEGEWAVTFRFSESTPAKTAQTPFTVDGWTVESATVTPLMIELHGHTDLTADTAAFPEVRFLRAGKSPAGTSRRSSHLDDEGNFRIQCPFDVPTDLSDLTAIRIGNMEIPVR